MTTFKKILLDLDGTVLDKNGQISDALLQALREVKNDISISFCTGRTPDFVIALARQIGLQTNHIVDDGSRVIDSLGKDLWSICLPNDVVTHYLGLAKEHHFKIAATVNGKENLEISDGEENLSRLFPYYLTEEQTRVLTTTTDFPSIEVKVVWFDKEKGYNVSITDINGNKRHGIKFLLDHEQVKKEEVIGVGDGINDIPLFEGVGYKVAMENAVEDLKKLADEVIPSVDENGVIHLLKKLSLDLPNRSNL